MTTLKPQPTVTILLGGVFLLLDQMLKYLALHSFNPEHTYLGVVGWKPFLNPGVAFSLPVPQIVILLFTFPVLLLLAFLIYQSFVQPEKNSPGLNLALSLVFFGALSNLIDRLLYQHTVDYMLIFTAVLNLADVMIVAGFLIYLLFSTHKKRPL